ncbi:hypothetical protein ACQ4LE_004672 [Meloidogyne hapla]|uniref:Uncharacterized protein n=1 Tax=Meloidogyne hapla TaxID=6305 RepID=A0A1I8BPC8_MELHA
MYYFRKFNKYSPLFSPFLLIFFAYLESANGYLVGRLLSLQNVADAHKQLLTATATGDHKALLKPPLVVIAMPELPPNVKLPFELDNNNNVGDKSLTIPKIKIDDYQERPLSLTKKSPKQTFPDVNEEITENEGNLNRILNIRSIRDPITSGARNCFFTPIQCMIQHDMSKYRKLVDSDIRLQRSG